jgi:hypothetical protein
LSNLPSFRVPSVWFTIVPRRYKNDHRFWLDLVPSTIVHRRSGLNLSVATSKRPAHVAVRLVALSNLPSFRVPSFGGVTKTTSAYKNDRRRRSPSG